MSIQYVRRRSRPRISVNKLGEYLAESKSTRRQAILRDQQRVARCRVIQYHAARQAIVDAIAGLGDPQESLARHLERLKEWRPAPGATEFDERENRLCVEAVQAFLEIFPNLDLCGLMATPGQNDVPKLQKAGVEISVRPELVLRGLNRQGQPVVGAVKLHFPKTYALGAEACDYVGAILHEYAETHLAGPDACDGRFCFVIDVPSRQIRTAPRNYTRRRSEVEMGCREIAMLWDSVSEAY